MAKFLLELSVVDYHSLQFLPSQLAAAALYIATKICGDGEWVCILTQTLNCDFILVTVFSMYMHVVSSCTCTCIIQCAYISTVWIYTHVYHLLH